MKRTRTRKALPAAPPPAVVKSLAIVRDSDGRLWSHIRKRWLVDLPEERVRQQYVCTLVNEYGFSLDQMDEEIRLPLGRGAVRADLAVWRTPQDKADRKTPLIVVECKADNVTITLKDYGQGESYARNVEAPFFVTHNNRETRFWRVKKDRMPGYVEEITDVPHAHASDREIEELIKKLKVFKEDEFADLLHNCHNVIRNREHLDPAAAFDEIAKVLFIKVWIERDMRRKKRRDNRFTVDYLRTIPGDNPLALLFQETIKDFRDDKLFATDEKLYLKAPTGEKIVELLERYNLSDTSEDVKGIAFERFLGRTFRGEIGQFFTPREIVKFMVEMVEPRFDETICDPASGSGGFLIRFFANVREQLLAEADKAYAKYKTEIEGSRGSARKKAEALRKKYDQLQRDLDPKVLNSSMWQLSNRCIYGTDANDRMARTSKMNMIMHGDGHGGVHHWNGFLNVNGIFDGRFDIILTNPPFGSHVESSALVELPEGAEWEESKRAYAREYGDVYREAVARVEAAKGKPTSSLFELPRRGGEEKAVGKAGKIKTEILFIERCLALLRPGGRLGIVLPEGIFNNPSLAYLREFCENRAFIRAVVSLPPETFLSSGASVKASLLFLQKFTTKEQADFDKKQAQTRTEIEAKHAPEIERETTRLNAAIETAREGSDAGQRKKLQRELADLEKRMAETIAAETRALLKERFPYRIFLYEAEKVGITATGEPDQNELFPNDNLPAGVAKTALEHYREFRNGLNRPSK